MILHLLTICQNEKSKFHAKNMRKIWRIWPSLETKKVLLHQPRDRLLNTIFMEEQLGTVNNFLEGIPIVEKITIGSPSNQGHKLSTN